MVSSKTNQYNLNQILASIGFFTKYLSIWQKELGDEFFTRDHFLVFLECCRSHWEKKNFTISDAVRTMPIIAPAVARTRIEEAEKGGYIRIIPSETDARTKLVLPTELLEEKVINSLGRAIDLFRDTLSDISAQGPLPRE